MDDFLSGGDGPGQIEPPAPQDRIARIVDDARRDGGQAPIASTPVAITSGDGAATILVLAAIFGGLAYFFAR